MPMRSHVVGISHLTVTSELGGERKGVLQHYVFENKEEDDHKLV